MSAQAAGPAPVDRLTVAFRLDGRDVTVDVPAAERLLDTLRYRLGATGTKEGCGEGECGACSVRIDGLPANACLVPACQVRGRSVDTVASVAPEGLAPFLSHGATQCGACTPGVVVTAAWLLENKRLLETHTARELMAGNLCRCTGYDGIIDAIEAARGEQAGNQEGRG